MTDQPTAGVALLAEAQKIAAELHPELFSEVTRTAHRAASPFSIEEARADKVRDALMFLAAQATVRALCTPASGPVEADDRLAVARTKAVEAMRGAIEWDKARGYRMPYRVRDPIYEALALLTSGEAGE